MPTAFLEDGEEDSRRRERTARWYCPYTKAGTFTQALYEEAKKDGWLAIGMKDDWKRIFAFDR